MVLLQAQVWRRLIHIILLKTLFFNVLKRPTGTKSKKYTGRYFYERVIKSFLKATYCGTIHKLHLYFLLLHDYMTSTVRLGATEQNAKDMKGHSHTITIPPRVHSQACG